MASKICWWNGASTHLWKGVTDTSPMQEQPKTLTTESCVEMSLSASNAAVFAATGHSSLERCTASEGTALNIRSWHFSESPPIPAPRCCWLSTRDQNEVIMSGQSLPSYNIFLQEHVILSASVKGNWPHWSDAFGREYEFWVLEAKQPKVGGHQKGYLTCNDILILKWVILSIFPQGTWGGGWELMTSPCGVSLIGKSLKLLCLVFCFPLNSIHLHADLF